MFSQRDEEKYIIEATKNCTCKRVLDIGAFHATCFSNSRALIEAGWEALLIEPSPGPVRDLVREYGKSDKVQVIAAAVTVQPEWLRLAITDDAVSTSEDANAQEWRERGGFFGYLTVPCITIPEILQRYGEFQCVSIDTEGTSVPLFRQLVSLEMFPACIVVEHDGREGEAIDIAQARGYKLLYRSAENLVFGL